MMLDSSLAAIRSRFAEFDLHDSRLLDVAVRHGSDAGAELVARLSLRRGTYPKYWYEPGELILLGCTYVSLEIDFAMKGVCGDAISSAECLTESSLRTELESELLKDEDRPLSSYLEFVLHLCPPSGAIHAFALDFRFRS